MLPPSVSKWPSRVLMTLDAVGGVWRYAVDLARGLSERSVACLLVGFGPPPETARLREVEALAGVSLVWTQEPLDWMVDAPVALAGVPAVLNRLARDWRPDLLHLNLPSQAVGLSSDLPVVVASHSCLASWWAALRGSALPAEWEWQRQMTSAGLRRAGRVLAPSASHANATCAAYGPLPALDIVYNACAPSRSGQERQEIVLAAGRWWDEGKNAATLDAAAALSPWPIVMAGATMGPAGQTCALRHALPLGELPADSVGGLMEHAAIFVSPSLYEPFGLAVLEAARRGAALILSDIPTFRELWDDAALFVTAREPAAYALAIAALADNPSYRASLARAAGRRAAGFTSERQVDGVLSCYAQALRVHSPTLQAAE
jgi:glycosyltransferase involved in cell wall biosynthesis